MPAPFLRTRLFHRAKVFAMIAIAGIASLFVALWVEHRLEISLPTPTGHFAVGRTTFAWTNDAQIDELAPVPGVKRQVLVWVWYPALAKQPTATADYLPASLQMAVAQSSGILMSDFLTRNPAVVRVHSSLDPAVSPEQPSYPVVMMRAGGGALTTDFTTLAEDLASHGYIVVGFDAPYRTVTVLLPEGQVARRAPATDPEGLSPVEQDRLINKLLPMWTGDSKFVVDQMGRINADSASPFKERLDLSRLGFFGHSFGGATALQFCHDDARCKVGIDIDGAPYGSVVKDGLTQPFLFLLSDHGDLSDPEARKVSTDIRTIYDRLPNGRLLLMIRKTNHFSFSDQILLKSQIVIKLLQLVTGGLDGRRGLAVTTSYVHTFFDVYLKHEPANRLDSLRQTYPEVQPLPR